MKRRSLIKRVKMNKFVLYGYLFFVVIAGNNASIHEKVVICGVCKDVAGRLPFSIKIMEKIGALFQIIALLCMRIILLTIPLIFLRHGRAAIAEF